MCGLVNHGGRSDFSYVTFMMDLSDITRDVFQLIASVDAKFDRVSWKLQKSGQKYNFSLVWPIENCDRSNPPRNEVNATARLEAGKPSNSKPRKNKSPAQVKRDKVRLEVWRKTWRVGKRGNHGNQDKAVASPHTPPVSVDVLPSADIQYNPPALRLRPMLRLHPLFMWTPPMNTWN